MSFKKRHERTYEPGRVANEKPKPRVLVVGYGDFWDVLADVLRPKVQTLGHVSHVSRVNLNEWDCLVIMDEPVTMEEIYEESGYERRFTGLKWTQAYPEHLSVIFFHRVPTDRGGQTSFTLVDVRPPSGEATDLHQQPLLLAEWDTIGTHVRPVSGLPDRIDRLVQEQLVPAVSKRNHHLTFRDRANEAGEYVGGSPIRAFLYGPDDTILAGSYERNDHAAVWLLPFDMERPDLWVIEALREWHEDYPDRFPLIPDWQQMPQWRTAQERALHAAADEKRAAVMAAIEAYKIEDATFKEQAQQAAAEGDRYERALLAADGDVLSDAVLRALTDIGFRVLDMDQVYPEGDKREDFQVFDDDDPDWVVLVEVKGFKNGISEKGIHVSLSRWIRRYVLQHRTEPAGLWYIANHNRLVDPGARPDQFRGKSEVLETFVQDGGLVIDTRALFDLLVAVQEDPTLKPVAKALLKNGSGLISRVEPDSLNSGT